MSIEEAGTIALLVDSVRWLVKLLASRLLRMEDKTISDEIMEIKQQEPLLGHILDRMHHMNLKETYTGLLVMDALEHIYFMSFKMRHFTSFRTLWPF
jgi:hypothetical protein